MSEAHIHLSVPATALARRRLLRLDALDPATGRDRVVAAAYGLAALLAASVVVTALLAFALGY